MTPPAFADETEEKPLDPAFEKVRRKMVRLLGVSIGVMLVGLMAVLFAIVYRTTAAPARPPGLATGTIRLPAGAAVLSQAASGERISLHVRLAEGGEEILLYDSTSDRIVGRFAIGSE